MQGYRYHEESGKDDTTKNHTNLSVMLTKEMKVQKLKIIVPRKLRELQLNKIRKTIQEQNKYNKKIKNIERNIKF